MKMLKYLLSMIAVIAALIDTASAQNRLSRPIQLQFNFAGEFLNVAGNTLADPTVDDIKVNQWRPGISIGYHVNRFIYLGYSLSPPLDLTLREEWGFNFSNKDGNIILDHKTGIMQNLEARLSPFKFGLYFSLSYVNIGEVDYSMEFRRKSDKMILGDNSYETDLDVKWNSKSVNRVGLGLGYNLILKTGLSFNFGLNMPLGFPENENVQFTPVNITSSGILPSDLEKAKAHLNDETFYGPIFLFVNVGYNFSN